MAPPCFEGVVPASCALLVVLVAFGIFGGIEGGGSPTTGWFGWHPVLMTLACPCLMPIGRLAYLAPPSWPGLSTPEGRRTVHGAIMSFSLTAMLLGYFCIFKAHLAQHKFFGYDFHRGAWAEWARVAHAWLGYVVISLSFFQAVVGIAKLNSHKLGERRFRFHGQVGKATMFAGAAVMLLAVKFWAWSMSIKIAVVALVVSAVFIGVSQPRPAPEGETQCIAGGET
mmetsp:Transcript_125138/g.359348  ORF Transcript_125138/g.359348 Transcript_125138/m.359348 type:complete len:226 (-) Transcript_125138:106-783(-)